MIHLANGVSFSCIAFAEVVLDVDGRVIYSDLLCESDNWEQASKDVLERTLMAFKDKSSRKAWREKNLLRERARERAKVNAYHARLKLKAMTVLSGSLPPICIQCSCDDIRILEINHKNGDGREDRIKRTGKHRNSGGGAAFYRMIVNRTVPLENLEVRCKVCNWEHYVRLKYGARYTIIWQGGNELPASPGPKGSR